MLEWPERWWQGAGAALPLQARAAAGHLAAAHGHAPFAARGRDQDQADFQQPRLLQRAVQAYSGEADISYTVAWPRSGHLIASILEDGQPFALRFSFVLLSSKQTLSFKFSFRWASRADSAVVGSVGQDDEGGEETWEDRARQLGSEFGC